jgi:polyisoprenoid-binding protein YceI
VTAGPALLVALTLAAPDRSGPAAGPTPVSYRIDVPRSRFVVATETSGMPSMFGHDHKVEVGRYVGEVTVVPGQPATAVLELSVEADSLRAVEERDDEISAEIDAALRERVLETRTYPTITFKSRSVKAIARQEGTFDLRVAGTLDLHGVRRDVTIPCKVAFQGDSLQVTGTIALRQRDFKIARFSFAGGTVTVADRVTLLFTIVAREAAAAPARRYGKTPASEIRPPPHSRP